MSNRKIEQIFFSLRTKP